MRNIRLTREYFYLCSIAAVPAASGGAAAAQPGGGQLLVPLLPVLRARGPGQEGQQRHQVRYQHLDISR